MRGNQNGMIRLLNETKRAVKKDRKVHAPITPGKSVEKNRKKLETISNGRSGVTQTQSQQKEGKFESIFLNTTVGLTRVGRNIDERKIAEDDLRSRAEEFEKAYKDMESFSCSLSHELREPLIIIDWFSRQLLKKYQRKLDAEGIQMLAIINETSGKMTQLITNLLSFACVNLKEIQKSSIDMKVLAEKVLDGMRLKIGSRKVQIRISELPSASGDGTLISQVLANLLSNALKYTRPKESANIEIDGYEKEGQVIYSIKDNGIGFSAKHAGKLFSFFQRLHPVEEFEGSGIGLVITKRIIEKHGGQVWAEGKLNKGATFFFSLPKRQSELPD